MYGRSKGYDDYKEMNVLTAPPERLLIMLFESLSTNLRKGRTAIEEGDLRTKASALRKSRDIVMELSSSLNYDIGGDIALNLNRLYMYVNARLIDADVKADVKAIDDAVKVMDILEDGFRQAVNVVMRDKAASRG